MDRLLFSVGQEMKLKKKAKAEWWTETLDHISSTWQKKKGRKYPFTGRDLKHIKQMRTWLTAPETMAIWSVYLSSSPFWGHKTGHLISGLWAERSILLDDPNFKRLTAKFEAELGLKEAKEVGLELFPK